MFLLSQDKSKLLELSGMTIEKRKTKKGESFSWGGQSASQEVFSLCCVCKWYFSHSMEGYKIKTEMIGDYPSFQAAQRELQNIAEALKRGEDVYYVN